MVAYAKRVASAVLVFVLFLQLSKAASIPISEPTAIVSPSENVTSSLLSKFIKLKSSTPEVPSKHDVHKRNALRDRSMRWPNATVPYELDGDFNDTQQQSIWTAMEHFQNKTCIRFIERSNQVDYVRIELGQESGSKVGRQGGEQQLTLTPGNSFQLRAVLHELMHTLGFLHEHNRPDRKNYVTIMWGNIQEGRRSDYKKENETFVDLLNTTYDYDSVMHNSARADSQNGKKTIRTRGTFENMGKLNKLSNKDILRIWKYYDCECVDRHDRCGEWSSSNDQCTNRRSYMLMNCPRSCNMCHYPTNY